MLGGQALSHCIRLPRKCDADDVLPLLDGPKSHLQVRDRKNPGMHVRPSCSGVSGAAIVWGERTAGQREAASAATIISRRKFEAVIGTALSYLSFSRGGYQYADELHCCWSDGVVVQ
jgi:hypothetical protein